MRRRARWVWLGLVVLLLGGALVWQYCARRSFERDVRQALEDKGVDNCDVGDYPDGYLLDKISSGVREREELRRHVVCFDNTDVVEKLDLPRPFVSDAYAYRVGWLGHMFPLEVELTYGEKTPDGRWVLTLVRVFGVLVREYGVTSKGVVEY